MVYGVSTTAITTNERNAFFADKTLFVGKNVLEYRNADPQWRTSGSWASGSNETEPGFDARRAADNFADAPTKPQLLGGVQNTYYLLFELQAAPGGVQNSIDCVAILGHNFNLLNGTVTVTVTIADSNDFITNPRNIAIFSNAQADGIRLADLNLLTTFSRYTNVQWLRIKVATTALFSTIVPTIGEVFCGQRLQMGRRPNQPWTPKRIRGDIAQARTKAGTTTHYERNSFGVQLVPTWWPHINGADPFTGLNDETTLWTLFQQAGGGKKNFLFFDLPSSSPRYFHFCDYADPDFEIVVPEGLVDCGEFSAEWLEQAPFYWAEVSA